jgi:hypothetical protein
MLSRQDFLKSYIGGNLKEQWTSRRRLAEIVISVDIFVTVPLVGFSWRSCTFLHDFMIYRI